MKTNPMKNRNRFSLKIYLLFSSKMITRIYLQYFRLSIFMIQVSVLYDEKKSATKCTYRVSHSFRPITFLFLCTNFSMPKFQRKRVVLIHSEVMGAVLDFWTPCVEQRSCKILDNFWINTTRAVLIPMLCLDRF